MKINAEVSAVVYSEYTKHCLRLSEPGLLVLFTDAKFIFETPY